MVNPENIPSELEQHPQWVNWRYVDRGPGQKPAKQPINPRTGKIAGVQWPDTWYWCKAAIARLERDRLDGIGRVLTTDDPYTAIDIDDCLSWNGSHYQLSIDAQAIIEALQSYTEISPSGRGLRVLIKAPGFQENHRSPGLEIYSCQRYVTITGNRLRWCSTSIETRTTELGEIVSRHFPSKVKAAKEEPQFLCADSAVPPADDALWTKIFNSKPQLSAIFNGDLSAVPLNNNGEPDQSHAVILLLNSLAFWTGRDAGRMRRMIKQTYLNQSRWEDRRGNGDWLDYQIQDSIKWTRTTYGDKK